MTTMLNLTKTSMGMTKNAMCRKYRDIDDQTGDEDIRGKVVLVTGGNGGIGAKLVQALAKRGATVLMTCRDTVKAQQKVEEIKKKVPDAKLVLVKLGLSDLDSVRSCAKEVSEKFEGINILINNAGYMAIHPMERTKDATDGKNIWSQIIWNAAPSRIVMVASSAWQFSDLNVDDLNFVKDTKLGYMNLRAYCNSKLCNMLFAKELGQRLAGTGITTYSLCPGFVNSNLYDDWTGITGAMNRGFAKTFAITEEQGSETVMYCALSTEVSGDTGKPYHFRAYWKKADTKMTPEKTKKVFEVTEEFVKTKFEDVFP